MSTTVKIDSIIDGLRARILANEFGKDGKLPSFRKLVVEYNTSQETMNKAIQALQAEGLLISMGARGVFINNLRIRVPAMVANFYQHVQQYGIEAMEELIDKPEIIDAPTEVKKIMHLSKNEQVLRRFRKQGSIQTPFRLAESFYPMSLINEKMIEQINNDKHFNIIQAIEENSNKIIKYTQEEIIARLPTLSEQEQLKIVRHNPIIYMKIVSLTKDKKTVIMYSNVVFNANLFLLHYTNEIENWS